METVKEKKQAGNADMQKMMQTARELGTPGAPHRLLAKTEGSWTTKTLSWAAPSMPPRESTGTSEQKMILDGHYLQNTESGDMMGSPYTGLGINGYDNASKKYLSTWISSVSTSIFYAEGTASADGKTITYESLTQQTPMGPMKFRIVTTMLDDNHYQFDMYGTGKNGQEYKMMQSTYTRKS